MYGHVLYVKCTLCVLCYTYTVCMAIYCMLSVHCVYCVIRTLCMYVHVLYVVCIALNTCVLKESHVLEMEYIHVCCATPSKNWCARKFSVHWINCAHI